MKSIMWTLHLLLPFSCACIPSLPLAYHSLPLYEDGGNYTLRDISHMCNCKLSFAEERRGSTQLRGWGLRVISNSAAMLCGGSSQMGAGSISLTPCEWIWPFNTKIMKLVMESGGVRSHEHTWWIAKQNDLEVPYELFPFDLGVPLSDLCLSLLQSLLLSRQI